MLQKGLVYEDVLHLKPDGARVPSYTHYPYGGRPITPLTLIPLQSTSPLILARIKQFTQFSDTGLEIHESLWVAELGREGPTLAPFWSESLERKTNPTPAYSESKDLIV